MTKKTPVRKCIGCGKTGPKEAFIRLVRQPDGTFCTDRTGRMNGRGAYLCDNAACFALCEKKGALSRSFRMKVDASVYRALAGALTENGA